MVGARAPSCAQLLKLLVALQLLLVVHHTPGSSAKSGMFNEQRDTGHAVADPILSYCTGVCGSSTIQAHAGVLHLGSSCKRTHSRRTAAKAAATASLN